MTEYTEWIENCDRVYYIEWIENCQSQCVCVCVYSYCLVGLVVKASASGVEGPEFESRL